LHVTARAQLTVLIALGVTARTSVKEAAVELVGSAGSLIIAIHVHGTSGSQDTVLSLVPGISNTVGYWLLGRITG